MLRQLAAFPEVLKLDAITLFLHVAAGIVAAVTTPLDVARTRIILGEVRIGIRHNLY